MNEILIEQYLKIYEDKSKFNDAFWKWFGDSKVVDKTGKPLIVYHGTDAKFDEFKISPKTRQSYYSDGFYFTNRIKKVSDYGDNLFKCYLSMQKPFIFNNDTLKLADKYSETNNSVEFKNEVEQYCKYTIGYRKENDKFKENIIKDGYDGLIIDGVYKIYVVFSPNQIKSIDNKGSWSSSSNKIYEKVSDIEHLTDEITYFVKLRLNELHGKIARYTRKAFQYEKKLLNGNILDVFITLDHTKSYKNSVFQYGRELVIGTKELVDFQGNFIILDNREMVNKILSAVAHEITHYSQVIDKKIDVDSYDETNHSKMEVEHEAKLVELFSLIKSKEYDQALELLYTRSEYFESISWESFLEDLVEFGVSEHEERMFEKFLFEHSITLKGFFGGN